MDSCCENKAEELAELRGKQGRVLYIVLAINTVMFLFEFFGGLLAGSTALLADSLDMFGDATVYALTLYALHRSARSRAGAALVKGLFMLLFGVMVVVEAIQKSILGIVPHAEWMGGIALVALAANTVCFLLLNAHRRDDLNMRSTWLCSRNDLFANTSVIGAAILVGYTGSLWPDVIVGLAIAGLFLHSAWQVLSEAWREWKASAPTGAVDGENGSAIKATGEGGDEPSAETGACCAAPEPLESKSCSAKE
ncbi:cation transporter [Marinobacter halodurans]|uniref:Cation transporter n=1 Tax=Marinobacter halodurans TaxID=2528979 RepID=A0ABY1ZNR8_9GAMM|nr:cation diffusion facilitator family transporter [Marinobacter halodurans]TBW55712.1 cation transporter [Marinobacter halodurans]